jgi:hypothetical protein
MKIKGLTPQLGATRYNGKITVSYVSGGRIVVKKWPKPRRTKAAKTAYLPTPGPQPIAPVGGAPGGLTVAPISAGLPAITQQQVATWDATLACLKFVCSECYQAAVLLTGNTAFYVRDVLIMASYGHLLSWPGWGPFPTGQSDESQ